MYHCTSAGRFSESEKYCCSIFDGSYFLMYADIPAGKRAPLWHPPRLRLRRNAGKAIGKFKISLGLSFSEIEKNHVA
jgi:hypothetical protein